ncbi:MAG: sigma-54-dependent Fis family transcriptional regulator [Planctomycetaceae bacterium]|nr:sigma-54-dependent Fis family transcriptional regulator [Planctomycetales bacterium]MCB9873519.1 sigma-54-dependent Fis family transcriptional regulator [Planctomycetaceae bacterium]MCB9940429.1 sigma-54-dependent Fis family transcriptional regulator [Planctomycetaceae bacterium]HRX79435.1 sigma-54 dependent transcriptional regulator [Pirellulaceae bacterium]
MPTPLRILIADDERPARYALRKALECPDYEISEAENGQAAIEYLQDNSVGLMFLDLSMPVLDGRGTLEQLGPLTHSTEVIVVTADDSVSSAVDCIRLGASDYITKPYEIEQVRAIARRAAKRVSLEHRLQHLQLQLDEKQAFGALVGVSQPMRDLFFQMQRAAKAPIDILIRGETGTGKELIAREIHRLSPRSSGPFVAVNTAAIAESLAESELFGHVRGAFTGAEADRKGVFEQANGGTLFLDEIGDMPPPAQTKILRALQERMVQPVGSTKSIKVDVRVITATHQDLEQAIADHGFRQDLYYRIKGVELHVPPLRRRREDIILLANFFLDRIAGKLPVTPRFDSRAVDQMLTYAWPGNVRELEHAVSAAAAMADKGVIQSSDLPMLKASDDLLIESFTELLDLPLTEAKNQLVESFERQAIARALQNHGGNVSAAARQLGIHRQSLQQKIAQLGIRVERT